MFSLSIYHHKRNEEENDNSFSYTMRQIDKMLFYINPTALKHFRVLSSQEDGDKSSSDSSIFLFTIDEKVALRKESNVKSPNYLLTRYIRMLDILLANIDSKRNDKMKHFYTHFHWVKNNVNDDEDNESKRTFRQTMKEIFGNNAVDVIEKSIARLSKEKKKLEELKKRMENNENIIDELKESRNERKELLSSSNGFYRKLKQLIAISYPVSLGGKTMDSDRMLTLLAKDFDKVAEIDSVMKKLKKFIYTMDESYKDDPDGKFKKFVDIFYTLKNKRNEEEEEEEEGGELHDNNTTKYILEEVELVKLINKGVSDFNGYEFSVKTMDKKKIEYKKWQLAKHSLYENFNQLYRKTYFNMSVLNITNIAYNMFQEEAEDVDNEEKMLKLMTSIKTLIWKNIFNGLTKLTLLQGGETHIILKIESKNLVIYPKGLPDIQDSEENFFVLPYPRYQNVKIRIPLNGNYCVNAIFPNLVQQLDIEYSSPLDNIGISLNAKLHYGKVTYKKDLDMILFSYLRKKLLSLPYTKKETTLEHSKELFSFNNTLFLYKQNDIIDLTSSTTASGKKKKATTTNKKKKKSDDVKNTVIPPNPYYVELFGEQKDSPQSSNDIDRQELYINLMIQRNERRYVKMVLRDDEESEKHGLLSFEMQNNNSVLTTFSTSEIMDMFNQVENIDPSSVNSFSSYLTDEDITYRIMNMKYVVDEGSKRETFPSSLHNFIINTKAKGGDTLENNDSKSVGILESNKVSDLMSFTSAKQQQQEQPEIKLFWPIFITSLFSYFIHHLELERNKNESIKYNQHEDLIFDGYVDDWLSNCHSFDVYGDTKKSSKSGKKKRAEEQFIQCTLVVLSTFSMSRGILRLKIQTVMTHDHFKRLKEDLR
jgi:hypothetical protein